MKKVFFLGTMLAVLVSCNNDATTTETDLDSNSKTTASDSQESREERNKQAAISSLKGFESRDANVILKDAAPDAVDYGDGNMPPTKGLDSIRAGLSGWLSSIESMSYSDLNAVADGDYVFVYAVWSGKYANDFMGMKTKGKSYKVHDVDIFKFNNDGKIVEHRSVQSNATSMAQMGVQPPQ